MEIPYKGVRVILLDGTKKTLAVDKDNGLKKVGKDTVFYRQGQKVWSVKTSQIRDITWGS